MSKRNRRENNRGSRNAFVGVLLALLVLLGGALGYTSLFPANSAGGPGDPDPALVDPTAAAPQTSGQPGATYTSPENYADPHAGGISNYREDQLQPVKDGKQNIMVDGVLKWVSVCADSCAPMDCTQCDSDDGIRASGHTTWEGCRDHYDCCIPRQLLVPDSPGPDEHGHQG